MHYFNTAKEKKQFYFTYLAFMLNGILALSIGSLLPFIREARGLGYAFAGLLVSLHSVGNLVSSFTAGALPVLIGRKKSILLFNACYALSYLLILMGNTPASLVAAFLMTGLARGASSNFGNVTINNLAPGKAAFLNGLHAMFSIGAFLFPIFLTLMTRTDAANWIYACYFMVAMGILSWILYFMVPVDEIKQEEKKEKKSGNFGFFKEPLFYLCTFTLFFYLCAEQGVIGWLITYFVDTGLLSDALSQLMASVLWIMMLAGRLTTAWASERVRKERLLLIMGFGIVVFFFWLLLSRNTALIVIGIMGFGYSMAGIYPTTVSFCGTLIKKYAMAWSFILTMASMGSILMPSVIGRIAEGAGIAYGMSSVVVVVLIDLALIIALNRYIKNERKEEKGEESKMKTEKNRIWNPNEDIDLEAAGSGVNRKILSYTDELMVVENHFAEGAVGAMHHHPHTQITYVVSGQFEFTIAGEKKIVNPGDTMLKKDEIEHGCVCLKEGVLLDIFTPMREDFVE